MKYFKMTEFACKCGCGLVSMHYRLMELLDNAREVAGVPFDITSGCRCEKHNVEKGGEPDSSHLPLKSNAFYCTAVDILTVNSAERYTILRALIMVGFNRIGLGKDFIHVDIDPHKIQNRFWHYYEKNNRRNIL